MHPSLTPIPKSLQPLYTKLWVTLMVGLALVGIAVAYTFLFPTVSTSFDFRNPKSSKNQIFDPRSESNLARTNGKLEAGGQLIANTSPLGDFSHLSVALDLEKRSETPSQIEITVRKNYRAFLLPINESIADFSQEQVFRIGDTYYALREGTLRPFVSEAAFLSRFPKERAVSADASLLQKYPVSGEWLGFRVGSLLSNAAGVFVVTSETEIRPIGSAEIFLALGFNFDDVVPVNEEDLGIYKRGRIILMGALHPDGTLFEDAASGVLYMIDGLTRRRIVNGAYRDFLLAKAHPILAHEPSEETTARCIATTGLLPRALDCSLSLDPLRGALGSDYELRLTGNDQAIDIATLTLDFGTRIDAENMTTLLAKIKQRILTRFGLATP